MYLGSYHVSKRKHEKGFKTSCMLEASYNLVLLWCKADVRDCLCFCQYCQICFSPFACPQMANAHLKLLWNTHVVKINKKIQRKIVNIFLPIIFSIWFGCSKEPSHRGGSFDTHNICFGLEIRKLCFCYTLLSKVLGTVTQDLPREAGEYQIKNSYFATIKV